VCRGIERERESEQKKQLIGETLGLAAMDFERAEKGQPLTAATQVPGQSYEVEQAQAEGSCSGDAGEKVVLMEFANEFWEEAKQTAMSVSCLAVFIASYTWLFLGKSLLSWEILAFLVVAIVGLSFFALGIRYGLMPLGELVGARLPLKCSMLVVFAAVFALGVLCTIAEPAIGSLRTAGENTDRNRAPLLAAVLDSPFSLMVAVGIGVGGAAMFGTIRVVLGWGIKPCVYLTCAPSILLTLGCVALGGSFPALTGLAWDCGAVTTGPVTVPIVLALGLGVAAASKKPRSASANAVAVERERLQRKSLQPRWSRYSAETQRSLARTIGGEEDVPETPPSQDDDEVDLSGSGIVTFASLFPVATVWTLAFISQGAVAKEAQGMDEPTPAPQDWELTSGTSAWGRFSLLSWSALVSTLRAIVPLVSFLLMLQLGAIQERIPNPARMMWGMVFCFVGMFLFSVGLDGALTPLGQGAGAALPEAMEHGQICGPIVILAFAFLSGFIATFAEPALAALGETVEKNTKGKFGKFKLIFAVAIGVGLGIVLGMMKVFYNLPLWVILTVGYSLNLVLTHFADEVVASIAWDSAGVTTGPVTVPIVLASGLALGKEAKAVEGFGILTCASIMPIFAVLVSGLLSGATSRRGPQAAAGDVRGERSSAPAALELPALPATATGARDAEPDSSASTEARAPSEA